MKRLITDIGNGIKEASTIASAEALPIATLLGSIKRNIVEATIAAPSVMRMNSFRVFIKFCFCQRFCFVTEVYLFALISS